VAQIGDLGQLCRGELRLDNLSQGASSYLWSFPDNTSSTETIPEKTLAEAGEYEIILTAADGLCMDMDTLIVRVDEETGLSLEMPNIFTPNGDNQNDTFGPVILNDDNEVINITTFKIYNRYGALIYDNEDSEGWKGFFRGDTAPPEVYAYFIEIDVDGCNTISKKGNVTLVR